MKMNNIDDSNPDIVLDVQGMMCQKNCASTVEKALTLADGVTKAIVRFKESEAYIWGTISVKDAINVVESIGFDANIKKDNATIDVKIESISPLHNKKDKKGGKSHEKIAVNDSGQPADIILKVRGMFDPKVCVKKVKETLESVDGVMAVKVDFKSRLVYAWGFADMSSLIHNLNALGYNATSYDADTEVEDGKKVIQSKIQSSHHRLEVQIGGMSCAACMNAIETGVMRLKGVELVKVALLAAKAEILFDNVVIQSEEIVAGIEGLGYTVKVIKESTTGLEPRHKEYIFQVSGMSCANCALKIERTLKATNGVIETGVSCMTNRARVIVNSNDESSPGPRDIMNKIQTLGYGCQMAQKNMSNQDETDGDLKEWTRLLFIALFLGIPVLILHMMMGSTTAMMVLNRDALCDGGITFGQTLNVMLNVPMQVIVGYRFYRGAFLGIRHGNYGMDLLVVMGTTITFMYSCYQLWFACATGISTKNVFFEASGMLFMFVTIGKYMEAYAKGKTVSAITNLLKLQPRMALLVTPPDEVPRPKKSSYGTMAKQVTIEVPDDIDPDDNSYLLESAAVTEINLDLVQCGDVVKVLPGSRIPTDGYIVHGNSYIDESMITGESIPKHRTKGEFLFGSTLNQTSILYVHVTSVGAESALSQIVNLVEEAQMQKAPVQAYADKIAGVFTPIVITLALCTFLTWSFLAWLHLIPREWFAEEYGDPLLFAMLFGISVIVISCPCALGLATPTAIMVGTSVGAANGILIKGGPAFETAHKITTVIFDKTGTLTEGKALVTDEILMETIIGQPSTVKLPGLETAKERLLRLAATAEQGSDHPLAHAVLNAANFHQLSLEPLGENACESIAGSGIRCKTSEGTVLVGNRSFMEKNEMTVTNILDSAMWDLEVQGKTAVCVALDNKIIGILGICDTLKPEAQRTIEALKGMGLDVWMVTGDNKTTAEAIASQLSIPKERIVSGAMPVDKVLKVEELQNRGQQVAMIGDGINDSPALARSNLGIAIGAGTHVAVEAADMVLIRNNLLDVVVALDLAKLVFQRIKLNFMWAIVYNILAIPFAAGLWFPWTHMLVPPQYAGLAMAFSSISVVASSMSLRLYKRPKYLQLDAKGINLKFKGKQQIQGIAKTLIEKTRKRFDKIKTKFKETFHSGSRNPKYSKLSAINISDDDGQTGLKRFKFTPTPV